MNAIEKYQRRVASANSLLCVGLDSDFERLPERFRDMEYPQFAFNQWVVEQTHPYVCAYKPNMAFYEARGEAGWHELQMTMDYLRANHADIFTICDAKRGDIDSTNNGYVRAIFDELGFDAVTLNPYLGAEAMQPFLIRDDKVCIILCRTSNPGAGEFQDLLCDDKPLWQFVAKQVHDDWNRNSNCMVVVGATNPTELATVRQFVGDMTLLVPGIGAQGGDLQSVVKMGMNSHKQGLIVNASRSVIFADDPQSVSRTYRDKINSYRE